MRQVVLDTETTGLEPGQGHRIIEVGCVELLDRRHTGRHFHVYLQPDRSIDPAAEQIHGITTDFLRDKPRFQEVADQLIDFLSGAELVIHNAPFDLGFLNHELRMLNGRHGPVEEFCGVLDTLVLARQMYPGQRNNLDALCKRFAVDNSQRDLHGALLDARILADVYLAMTGGQAALELDAAPVGDPELLRTPVVPDSHVNARKLKVVRASDAERIAHEQMVDSIRKLAGHAPEWPVTSP